jgi:hypothetical protein
LVHMMNVNQRAKEANNEKKKKEPPNWNLVRGM